MTAYADLVVRNATIFTAASDAPGVPRRATGFAATRGRFTAVTSDDSELAALTGPHTVVVDLGGASVVPGLIDVHTHHVLAGKALVRELRFASTLSLDGVLAEVEAWAGRLPEGAWLVGGNWGTTLLPELSTSEALTRLDAATLGHAAVLVDDSHHNLWANSAALTAAGIAIDATTTGVLSEAAADPMRAAQAASESNTAAEWSDYAAARDRERVRTRFTKVMLDGIPTTHTAGMLEPYLPDAEHGDSDRGPVNFSVEELTELLRLYRAQGRSTKVHCAGDRAVRLALDAFETLRCEGSTQIYQIAHGQFIAPEDRERMPALGVVADISPFLWFPGVMTTALASVLPADLATRLQPNRALLDLGALWPEQAVTVEEALRIFRINGARAAGLDDVVGSIEAGKAADFTVIDRDPFKADKHELAGTRVVQTFVAGELVYSASH